jgi:hypothetical protein
MTLRHVSEDPAIDVFVLADGGIRLRNAVRA